MVKHICIFSFKNADKSICQARMPITDYSYNLLIRSEDVTNITFLSAINITKSDNFCEECTLIFNNIRTVIKTLDRKI